MRHHDACLPNTGSERLESTASTLGSTEHGEMVSSSRGFLDLQRKMNREGVNPIGVFVRVLDF